MRKNIHEVIEFLIENKHDISYIDMHSEEEVLSEYPSGDPNKYIRHVTVEVKCDIMGWHGKPIVIPIKK